MIWLELTTHVDREAVEAVAEIFARHGHGGTVIEEPIVPEPGGDGYSLDATRPVAVKTYLPKDRKSRAKIREVSHAVWHLGHLRPVAPLEVREIVESDWANAWKAHYQVQHIGRRIVIRPSWQEYLVQHRELVMQLDPGMAFGTGTHPTTRLCLEAMEELVSPNDRVLDVGTGSGILAIAAAKLGASHVLALDLDEIAVAAAAENVSRNELAASVAVRQGTLGVGDLQCGKFQLVVANITARALAGLATFLADALVPSGHLLLSGIINDQLDLVHEAFSGLTVDFISRREAGDWLALVGRKT